MLETILFLQQAWSRKTFGDGRRTEGICKHIEKELDEVRKNPHDFMEWIDVVILGLDGAWRAIKCSENSEYNRNRTPGEIATIIAQGLLSKSKENMFEREWPPHGPEDRPIEHIRK